MAVVRLACEPLGKIEMAGRISSWALRLTAWACLLVVAGRLLLFPKQAWINGRIMQMEVRFETRRAETALWRELGLDAHYDSDRFRIHTVEYLRFSAPVWLTLLDRRDPHNETEFGPHIWLEPNGDCLLPPLHTPLTTPDSLPEEPWGIRLPRLSGEPLYAAIVDLDDVNFDEKEWTVWVYRKDRWVNALRIKTGFWLAPIGDPVTSVQFDDYSGREIEIPWNARTETFEIPSALERGTVVLDPLPDQTGYHSRLSISLSRESLEPYITSRDIDGLLKRYADASRELGYEIKAAETILNEMGYQAIYAGEFQAAIAILRRNVELYPNSANVHDSLAEAFEKDGQLERAKKEYESACRLGRKNNDRNLATYQRNLARVRASLADRSTCP